MKRDEEYWRKEAENRRIQVKYWKDKAKNPELTHKFFDVLEADPEMKWFILWLGAGAIEFLEDSVASGAFKPKAETNSDPRAQQSYWTWTTVVLGGGWLGEGGEQLNAAQHPTPWTEYGGTDNTKEYGFPTSPKMGLGDILLGSISPAFLTAKVLDWGIAGGISATALSMIILGRMNNMTQEAEKMLPVG